MDRVDKAKQLLIEEAYARLEEREDRDRVAILHGIYMELGLGLAQQMNRWRAEEREANGRIPN